MTYVFVISHEGTIEVFADINSLPGNVTSVDVRRAQENAGQMVTFRGEIKIGWLPVNRTRPTHRAG